MTHHVTAGLDGSAEGAAAARWAARQALMRGGPLEVVHVEEWLERPPRPVSTTEITRRWADALLEETAEELRSVHPGLEITPRRLGGLPSVGVAGSTPIGQAAVQVLNASHDAALVGLGRRIRHSALGTHIGR
ncbi:universal stress protein [Streptomyces sp. MS1.HAVA.3]|uniref:Universal stress protein n=1 Tax=Streptomyces caledonius TaxID=3134107 RepID=A0ABU8TZK8_9ACTN